MKPAVVVFDLFGTLLDIASLRGAVEGVCADPSGFVATWREKQVAYSFASAVMGLHEDFDALTAYAARYAAAKYGVALDPSALASLVAAWRSVKPHDDALPALERVRNLAVPLSVLTNGSPATARASLVNAGLAQFIDATLSVEDAGVFKPDRRVYALVTERYAVPADRILFVTSNGWDATGAAAFGMRVAWCNRSDVPAETFGPQPEWTVSNLSEIAQILDA